MGTVSSNAIRRDDASGGMAHAVGGALMRWWAAYMAWRIEQLAIARLGAMSDRQLADIGIVRAHIELAVKGERIANRRFRNGPRLGHRSDHGGRSPHDWHTASG